MSELSKLRGTLKWLPKHINGILDQKEDFTTDGLSCELRDINKAIQSAVNRIDKIYLGFNPVNAVKGQVVRIKWVDAVSVDTWEETEVDVYGPARNTTAGIAIHIPHHEHPWWVIARDITHHLGVRQASGQMVIPCSQVSEVQILSPMPHTTEES